MATETGGPVGGGGETAGQGPARGIRRAWALFLIGCVVFVGVGRLAAYWSADQALAEAAETAETAETADAGGPNRLSPMMELQGKVQLGVREVAAGLAGAEAGDGEPAGAAGQGLLMGGLGPERTVRDLRRFVETPTDELAWLVVGGEMIGPEWVATEAAAREPDGGADEPPSGPAAERLRAARAAVLEIYAARAAGELEPADPADGLLGEVERTAVLGELGFFGRVALGGAERDQAMDEAAAAAGALIAASVVIFVLVGLGVLALIAAIALIAAGKIRSGYAADARSAAAADPAAAGWGPAWVEAAALFVWSLAAVRVLGDAAAWAVVAAGLGGAGLAVVGVLGFVLQWATGLAVLWPVWRGGVGWGAWRWAVGWHARGGGAAGFLKEMVLGLCGYLAGLPIVAVMFAVSLALLGLFEATPSHPVQEMVRGAGVWGLAVVFVLACLWAPFVEELVFRGVLYHHLRGLLGLGSLGSGVCGMVVSGVVSGVIFAAIHPQGLLLTPALASLGFVFAMIREWRGSVAGAITAHAVHNAAVVSLAVAVLG